MFGKVVPFSFLPNLETGGWATLMFLISLTHPDKWVPLDKRGDSAKDKLLPAAGLDGSSGLHAAITKPRHSSLLPPEKSRFLDYAKMAKNAILLRSK